MSRLLTAFALVLMLALTVGACGKKGPPAPPSDDAVFPRSYPTR